MKNLNSLQINSRNTEVDAVSGRIINEYNKGNWSSDVHLTGVITLLVQKSGKLTRAVNRIETESDLEIKKEVLSIINEKLVVYLNAMIQVNETKYGEFAVTVAQIIDDMNVTVKKRKKNPEPAGATTTIDSQP
jgi:hypothetical protein